MSIERQSCLQVVLVVVRHGSALKIVYTREGGNFNVERMTENLHGDRTVEKLVHNSSVCIYVCFCLLAFSGVSHGCSTLKIIMRNQCRMMKEY